MTTKKEEVKNGAPAGFELIEEAGGFITLETGDAFTGSFHGCIEVDGGEYGVQDCWRVKSLEDVKGSDIKAGEMMLLPVKRTMSQYSKLMEEGKLFWLKNMGKPAGKNYYRFEFAVKK